MIINYQLVSEPNYTNAGYKEAKKLANEIFNRFSYRDKRQLKRHPNWDWDAIVNDSYYRALTTYEPGKMKFYNWFRLRVWQTLHSRLRLLDRHNQVPLDFDIEEIYNEPIPFTIEELFSSDKLNRNLHIVKGWCCQEQPNLKFGLTRQRVHQIVEKSLVTVGNILKTRYPDYYEDWVIIAMVIRQNRTHYSRTVDRLMQVGDVEAATEKFVQAIKVFGVKNIERFAIKCNFPTMCKLS